MKFGIPDYDPADYPLPRADAETLADDRLKRAAPDRRMKGMKTEKWMMSWMENENGERVPVVYDEGSPPGQNGICTLWTHGHASGNVRVDEARKNLILAAPDLLAALKTLLNATDDLAGLAGCSERAIAKAAIAKAETT
jgi:hypothetical protein